MGDFPLPCLTNYIPKTIPPKNNHVSIGKIMAKHLFLVRQPVTQMRQSRVCLYLPLLVCQPDSHSKLKGTRVQRIPAETNYACVCRSGPDIKHVVVVFCLSIHYTHICFPMLISSHLFVYLYICNNTVHILYNHA